MQTEHGLSARRADRVLQLSRSARHYRLQGRDGGAPDSLDRGPFEDNPGHGFGLLFAYALQSQGWGKTRAWRVDTALKLTCLAEAAPAA